MCDVGEDERLGLGTGWPAEEVWQNIELPGSVPDVKRMTLQLEGPTHQFCILIAHGFDVAKRWKHQLLQKKASHNWVVAVLDGTPNVTSGPRMQHWPLQTI